MEKIALITGASRGIGLAIGLRAARDGANVVIAAKTAEPHKKLPGTIYTAAEEIEKAGGFGETNWNHRSLVEIAAPKKRTFFQIDFVELRIPKAAPQFSA